jgi:glycosyltransferase involved in cell wall biosynthesis
MKKRWQAYRRKVIYEWRMLLQKSRANREKRHYKSWIKQLLSNPPEVLLGPNFSTFGGVKHHIEAITRHSNLRTELAPNSSVRRYLEPYHFTDVFGEHFSRFVPQRTKIVHSHVFPWFMNWCSNCSQNGIAWIHTYHLNYFPEHAVGPLSEWQLQVNEAATTVAKNATIRISVSKWQVEYFRSQFGIDSVYIPNGVDVALADSANPKRFTKRLGQTDFVLYIGRDDPVKNPAEFIRLANAVPERLFVMIGAGLSPQTITEKYNLPVPPNLMVIGALTQQQTQDAIAAASAIVVTSYREGLPTLVMEAMAANKPIIVPNEAGCMEAIGEGECGFIYNLGDIDDLARQLELSFKKPQVASRGRTRVLREYDWRVVASHLDKLYSEYL